ncbi:MAG: DUF3108 domain-containing protein [Acidobacteria bacterium]|nr:DUF3108 domain-containing protein [Acidobacteriota bacterium]
MSGRHWWGIPVLAAGIAGGSIWAQEGTPPADPAEAGPQDTGRSSTALPSGVDGRSAPLPFEVGERLAYRVSWAEVLEAGTAELRVTSGGSKGSGAYRLALDASSTPAMASVYRLQFQCSSLFDPRQGISREYRRSFKENGRTVRDRIVFNPARNAARYVDSSRQVNRLTIQLGAQDPVSAIYLLRTLGLKPGLRVLFPIVEGGETYQADVSVAGSELISTALGSFTAHRVEAVLRRGGSLMRDKKMTFWFTSDPRRIPVLASVSLPFGSLLVELISAR